MDTYVIENQWKVLSSFVLYWESLYCRNSSELAQQRKMSFCEFLNMCGILWSLMLSYIFKIAVGDTDRDCSCVCYVARPKWKTSWIKYDCECRNKNRINVLCIVCSIAFPRILQTNSYWFSAVLQLQVKIFKTITKTETHVAFNLLMRNKFTKWVSDKEILCFFLVKRLVQ